MRKAPGPRDVSNPPTVERQSSASNEPNDRVLPVDHVEDDRNPVLSLADAAASANGKRPPVSWAPPPSASIPDDNWPDDVKRLDEAALGLLSRPSWDDFQPDDDRFTFPPPIANGSSVAPVALTPEGDEQVAPPSKLRWSTLLIALGATLGMSALVLSVYGAATRSGNAMWGWNWKAAPQSTGASFAAGESITDDAHEALPGGLPPTAEEGKQEAMHALDRIARRAEGACTNPGITPTSVRVIATFGRDGKVQDAQVEPGRGGHTTTMRCVSDIVLSTTIPPFEGKPVTVSRTVEIP